MYVAFIDFRQAFDSVIRTTLWAILRKSGLKVQMYPAIVNMYNVVKSKVRTGNDFTELIMSPRGLKQGKICSPVLFSLYQGISQRNNAKR